MRRRHRHSLLLLLLHLHLLALQLQHAMRGSHGNAWRRLVDWLPNRRAVDLHLLVGFFRFHGLFDIVILRILAVEGLPGLTRAAGLGPFAKDDLPWRTLAFIAKHQNV